MRETLQEMEGRLLESFRALEARATAAEAREAVLRGIVPYAQHLSNCEARTITGYTVSFPDCTCGLHAGRAALESRNVG